MKLQQLEIFAVVVAAGSFSAAARQLGKAQSAVSTAISELEIDLAVPLFDRSQRYPQLTPAGERLLPQARQIQQQCLEFQELAGSLSAGMESHLTLAVDDAGQLPWLTPLLTELAGQFPRLELRLLFPLLEDVTGLLAKGSADLAIGFAPAQPVAGVHRWPLTELNFVLAVAPGHPLAQLAGAGVTLLQLQQYRQLMVTDRQQGQEKQRGRLAVDVWWVEGDLAVQSLVQQGLGWAWLPEQLARRSEKALCILPLDASLQASLALLPLQLELWQRAGQVLGPAGSWLKQRLLQQAARK